MTPAEIEAILREAFGTCEAIGYPLEAVQKQVLLQSLVQSPDQIQNSVQEAGRSDVSSSAPGAEANAGSNRPNPLDELTVEQRQILLRFIQNQTQENRSWKVQLLNDWLHSRDSGEMQVFRQQYGLQWLEQIQPSHIVEYVDEGAMRLRVGDRIEVSNRLWEWVQNDDPGNQEWFLCIVINLIDREQNDGDVQTGDRSSSCTVRFDNGMEYEIQGLYEWNRYNWRWMKKRQS